MASEGSLAQMEKAGIIDDANIAEAPGVNQLCKVVVDGLKVWRVLCLNCRNTFPGYQRMSLSLLECDQCCAKPATALNWQK